MRHVERWIAFLPIIVFSCSAGQEIKPGAGGGDAGEDGNQSSTASGEGGGDFDASSGSGAGTCLGAVTCADVGASCGEIGDGCGGVITCGDCAAPDICGGGGVPSACGGPGACVPRTCADAGANCGPMADGCGGLVDCGTCAAPSICGGGGVANVCGGAPGAGGGPCVNLCLQQANCGGGVQTTLSGTVFAPNGVDPLYGALVYVPNAPVDPFAPGVQCQQCGAEASGSPLVRAITGPDGTFTIENAPSGANIPLVIQVGRWRRQVTIPSVSACVDNPLPSGLTRLPRQKAEGDIPFMAFSTGGVDALECVLRKIGIDDSEFTLPPDKGGNGRVNLYQGNGATMGPGTPDDADLTNNLAALSRYDMVLFPCEGGQINKPLTARQNLLQYASMGGRIFATHYSYVWLFDTAPFSTAANWHVNQAPLPDLTGFIDTSFPKGQAFATWLVGVGASTTFARIPLKTIRHDLDGVVAPSQLWISADPAVSASAVMHFTFNTPVGAPADQQCGRVLYDDFHVEDAPTAGLTFPQECAAGPMSPQEKALEFMLFDLASCIAPDIPPPPPTCTPRSCADQGLSCGPAGDGCGAVIQCGDCPAGQTCGGGGTPSACGGPTCTPKTCADAGAECGPVADGCGGVVDCGPCVPPTTCGGGGLPNVCGGSGPN